MDSLWHFEWRLHGKLLTFTLQQRLQFGLVFLQIVGKRDLPKMKARCEQGVSRLPQDVTELPVNFQKFTSQRSLCNTDGSVLKNRSEQGFTVCHLLVFKLHAVW